MGYLCANFSLPRPLYSRLRPDVRDRQTSDRRQTASLLNSFAAVGDYRLVDTVPVPLATKVDRTPSVPLATVIAVFTNVRG